MARGASADGLSVWGGGAGARAVYVPAGHILSYEYFTGRGSGARVVEGGGLPGGLEIRQVSVVVGCVVSASTQLRAFDVDLQINIAPGRVSLRISSLGARACVCLCV